MVMEGGSEQRWRTADGSPPHNLVPPQTCSALTLWFVVLVPTAGTMLVVPLVVPLVVTLVREVNQSFSSPLCSTAALLLAAADQTPPLLL